MEREMISISQLAASCVGKAPPDIAKVDFKLVEP
jgi:hypothetical protein